MFTTLSTRRTRLVCTTFVFHPDYALRVLRSQTFLVLDFRCPLGLRNNDVNGSEWDAYPKRQTSGRSGKIISSFWYTCLGIVINRI